MAGTAEVGADFVLRFTMGADAKAGDVVEASTTDGQLYPLGSRQVRPGDVLHGLCGGFFGRDSNGCKTVEAVGRDWVVARDGDTALLASGPRAMDELPRYLDPVSPGYPHTCGA